MPNYFETTKGPIFAPDFHYFRLPREKWELMLTRLLQMGGNMLTVTVPWGFHEFEKGTIDLTGMTNARRDLFGLLELCAAFNLHCILNPGPYSNHCGILSNGLPHWLAPASDNFDSVLATATASWYRALSGVTVDKQWPDGPIVALRIDHASDQEDQPTYSEQLTEIKWPIWLRKRYKGIDALNEAHGTDYRSVNDVPFPPHWQEQATPLEKDIGEFLEEVEREETSRSSQILIEAGWRVPIYPFALGADPSLPSLETHSLATTTDKLADLKLSNTIIMLQDPIQIDPDPPDVGTRPVWANEAPIRADGSLRCKYWDVRQYLWSDLLPNRTPDPQTFTTLFETGGLATSGRDTTLRINLPQGTKPVAYHLDFNGELRISSSLKAARGKLSGPYLTQDDTGQMDLIFFLHNPTVPLSGFLLTYLRTLLIAQTQTLKRLATVAEKLGHLLEPTPGRAKVMPSETPGPTSYTLAEARRGLREADAILRKAVASIGGLEAGFDIMLDRKGSALPEPARASVDISPDIFEGSAREILIEAGKTLTASIPQLQATGAALQSTIDSPQGFTVAQYQQSYSKAISIAQDTRHSLLKIIARLRVEMASEKLPLVAWRVHHQIQELVENLRWGVQRG